MGGAKVVIAAAVITHPRDRRQPPRRAVYARASAQLAVQPCDLLAQPRDLGQQKARQVAHRHGQRTVIAINESGEAPDMRRAGRRDDAVLGQMGAQGVDRLRPCRTRRSRVR